MKEQEIQLLQAELEARTKELCEKMEQMHQQVRKDLKILHATKCKCDMIYGLYWKYLSSYERYYQEAVKEQMNPLNSKPILEHFIHYGSALQWKPHHLVLSSGHIKAHNFNIFYSIWLVQNCLI